MKTADSPELLKPLKPFINWVVPFVCILLCFNTVNHQFALDDYSVIITHEHVQNGIDGIEAIMTTNYRHGNAGFNDGLYRPLSLVSFALEKEYFNSVPSISHWINLVIYALGGLFLFKAFRKLFNGYSLVVPLAICLLFVAHPLHTEVIANIKGRDELFAFLGFSVCLYSIIKQNESKSIVYLSLAMLSYSFALLSKESAVTYSIGIPILLLIHPDFNYKKALQSLLFLLPLAVCFILWRNHIIESMSRPMDQGNFSLLNNPIAATTDESLRWGSTFALQLTYVSKLLFPFELIHDYSYRQLPLVSITAVKSIFGMLILIGLVTTSIWGLVKRNIWGISASFYLISIAVASQIAMPIGVQFAERLLFLAVLPLSIALTVSIYKIIQAKKSYFPISNQKRLGGLLLLVILLYSFKTVNRNEDWQNNLSLYRADIEKASNSARANYNLGSELHEQVQLISNENQRQQLLNQASEYLRKAIEIYPEYLDAYNNLGNVLKLQKKYDQAVKVYQKNISLDPDYTKNYYNLSIVYYESKQFRNSISAMQQYVSFVPNSAQAYFIMAQAAESLQSFEEAIEYCKQSLSINAQQTDVKSFLGTVYGKSGQYQAAANTFNQLVKQAPQRIDFWMNLAFSYHSLGDKEKEIMALKEVLRLDPQNQMAAQQINDLQNNK